MPELIHFVKKEFEGTYYTVPFAVPENVIKVTVSYSYKRGAKGFMQDIKPKNIIDLGLMDEKGSFLGWSGSAHDSIFVGEYASSNGYLTQKIVSGEWSIIVGAYHVVPEGVEVKYNIEFEYAEPKFLFGDLHIHTDASDGLYDAHTVGKMAKEKGLDFIALANHNNYSENFCLPHIPELTFIPAVEWTHYNGHMNFFGAKAPFKNSFIANDAQQMDTIINNARAMGAVISVNHPKCPFCPYKWDSLNFDMMEVWNGPMRGTNVRGVAWWTELLREGRRIPAVGGSDYHRPHKFVKLGNPVTAVYSESRATEDILSAIRAGHSYVTGGVDSVKLCLTYGDAMMGDCVCHDSKKTLKLKADDLHGEDIVLVTASGEKTVKKHARGSIELDIPVENDGFAYIKAVKGGIRAKMLRALTNPIYFNK